LGGGFGKLIVLILVILAVWYGYKYVNRVNEIREALRRRAAGPARGGGPNRVLKAEDMTKCRACGAYVAEGAASCGRPDCPF
jgi:hypothetical protein